MSASTAFVLSGGGSLGAVQVGMLQALQEAGVRPDLLVGTSAGALNALWVAHHGMSAQSLSGLADLWSSLRRSDIFPMHPSHLFHGLVGRSRAVSSSERLADLVRTHAGITNLEQATIPLHLVATDLLSGHDTLVSRGPVDEAVLASAAIPGVFPPVRLDGRWLVDGALATHTGVHQASLLGATEIYVLPTGVACALRQPPSSAIGVALHAVTLMLQQRLIAEVAEPPPGATIRLLPPLCPVGVSPSDFNHAPGLVRRGRSASARWLANGGTDLPDQARFLALHDHGADSAVAPVRAS